MRRFTLRAAVVLAIIFEASKVYAQIENNKHVSSKLQVHIPQNLFKPGGYDHREALFGVPPYGGSIAQMLYYADSDLCDSNVDTSKGYPSRVKDGSGKMEPWPSPYILMVDRGQCSFVQKARNAQRNGAAGVIIADNTCLCSAGDSCFSEPGFECERAEPIMADDGSGSDISIPSFLMFKQDADKLKAEMRNNKPIQLEMEWSIPSPDDRVEYDFFTIPRNRVAIDFLMKFREAAKLLDKRAYFTPHMYIYDGERSGCRSEDGANICYNLCTNFGRYCAMDPDNNLDRGISGADIVAESLRRICIWKHYGEDDGIGIVWWDYLQEFMSRCDNEEYFSNEECVQDAFKHAKVDGKAIDQCMKDSGGLTQDKKNQYFDNEITQAEQTGVVIIPAAFVNGAAIRGALSFDNVFGSICAGYLSGTEPVVCAQCSSCPDVFDCAANGGHCAAAFGNSSAAANSVSQKTFAGSLFLVCAVFGGMGMAIYSWQRRRMKDEVRDLVAQYMPLEDGDDKGTSLVGGENEFQMS